MDDLNDLIWQNVSTKSNGTLGVKPKAAQLPHAGASRGSDDLLDLASPVLPKTQHQLNGLDPLKNDESDAVPRPSVASMRNLWEHMGDSTTNSGGNGNSKYSSATATAANNIAAKQNRSASPLPAPHASKLSTSTTKSGHDPFGDLLGLGGMSQLGRSSSPSIDKKAPSLHDLSRTGSPASLPPNSKPSTPVPTDPWNLDLLTNSTGSFNTTTSTKDSDNTPPKPPRGHWSKGSTNTNATASTASPPVSVPSSRGRNPPINATVVITEDDDNPLGILAEPVTSKKAPPPPTKPKPSSTAARSPSPLPKSPATEERPPRPPRPSTGGAKLQDHDIAQIMEMGFSAEQARTALSMTKGDVEAAVGVLVQDREAASRLSDKQKPERPNSHGRPPRPSRSTQSRPGADLSSNEPTGDTATGSGGNERLWTAAEEIKQSVFSKASSLFQQSKTLLQEKMDAYQQNTGTSQPLGRSRDSTRISLEGDDSDDDDNDDDHYDTKKSTTPSKAAHLPEPEKPFFRPYRDAPEQRKSAASTANVPTSTKTAAASPATSSSSARSTSTASTARRPPPPPTVTATPPPDTSVTSALKKAEELRQDGNERFKAGHFMEAEKLYTQAIDALPSDHARNILLYNNRAAARLKNADYRAAIDDCGVVITMIGGETGNTQDGVVFKDQLCKALLRRATALQTLEQFGEAIRDYERAASHGAGVAATEGASQCRQSKAAAAAAAAKPTATAFSSSPASASPMFTSSDTSSTFSRPSTTTSPLKPATKTAFEDDWFAMGSGASSSTFSSHSSPAPAANAFARDWFAFENNASFNTPMTNGFGAINTGSSSGNTAVNRDHIEKSTAVAEMRRKEMVAKEEEQRRMAIKDQVEARVNRWRHQKEDNLRGLLCSLDSILWADAGVKQCGLQDLIAPSQVKIRYMKAIARLHPDKVSKTATVEQQLVAQEVFVSLNRAWDAFRTQNNM